MILVTGANGHLGRSIVNHLTRRLGRGELEGRLAVSVREPDKAKAFAELGIDVRQGDFDRPEPLAETFSGVETLVLISTDGPKEVRIRQHANAIGAAKEAGVGRILYTSFLDAAPDSPSEFAQVHAATESELRASDAALAIFRNTIYADYLPMTFGTALESGLLQLPAGQGKLSFMTRDEMGEAIAAATLAAELSQEVYELTGPSAHDCAEVATAVGALVGRSIAYETVSEEAYAKALEGAGAPAWIAAAMANMYTAVAEGRFEQVSDDFAALVGRQPKPLESLVQELFGNPG